MNESLNSTVFSDGVEELNEGEHVVLHGFGGLVVATCRGAIGGEMDYGIDLEIRKIGNFWLKMHKNGLDHAHFALLPHSFEDFERKNAKM